jgi:hypothetical protein
MGKVRNTEGNEELVVMTVVKVLDEIAENRQLWEDLNYLWGRDNLHHCEQSFLKKPNHSRLPSSSGRLS